MWIGYFLSKRRWLIESFLPDRNYFRNKVKNAGYGNTIHETKTCGEQ